MLRAAIEKRGLSDLIAPDGETAIAQLADQLHTASTTPTNYDPLMSAMFAISSNVADLVAEMGGNVLYVMVRGDEEVPVQEPGYEERTWPHCPLCHVNLAHEIFCRHPNCTTDKVRGFDHWIEHAADDQVKRAKELGLEVDRG